MTSARDPVRDLRAWRAAIAATPIVTFTFEPHEDGYVLEGRLDDVDVRAWMTERNNAVRLYDDDWEHFAMVDGTACCSADRAIRLMIGAVRRCGARRPTAVAETSPFGYVHVNGEF